jgi:hypothetical protein
MAEPTGSQQTTETLDNVGGEDDTLKIISSKHA